ncbi:2,5-diamino-6-(ribosylamino)-4(3H)-pyrimidinone 5'-phosphate reductase [Didymosphaeria variabile]|uniref:2,5-diamino-6-ribosylamino-4(3H)-pyrimidinone 5'-phosphate reductase n=1 Tax=Didymosphaeria variabile TaxID=1932322 RepID=A0A9W8XW55_9PLEO|nr:2,5-diamino-6-(ribosylamino)-4(3H)-pyrimidinone 5'-phosphate reductase [Didymosphaeria variabile]KAJ4359550.1 2,5-diamino-6-(ribosylamino)-4(3H)-pyrimidinone 5'-phosphate reductase [Didymosphaeria variabile]
MSAPTRDALSFPSSSATQIDPYLPEPRDSSRILYPHVTLTYATSLDANLSLSPGVQTALSGAQSKAMTHYLRSKHSAILIGAGTAVADDPSLNCRIEGVGGYGGVGLQGQPRPVVLDAKGRWKVGEHSKVIKLAKEGRGLGPWVIGAQDAPVEDGKYKALKDAGGLYTTLPTDSSGHFDWSDILKALGAQGITSVMIEGGGSVINELLNPRYIGLVDSVIITIAPVWLGKGGVQVCPDARRNEGGVKMTVGKLNGARWVPLGDDVVLCGRPGWQ